MLLRFLVALSLSFTAAAAASDSSACQAPTAEVSDGQIKRCEQYLAWPGSEQRVGDPQYADLILRLAQWLNQAGQYHDVLSLLAPLQRQQPQLPVATQLQLLRALGINHYRLGQHLAALIWFRQAEQLARQQQNTVALAVALSDLGTAYRAMAQWAQALAAYSESLTLKQQHDSDGQAVTLHNIGGLYAKLGDLAQAEQYLQQAANLYQQQRATQKQFHALEELALLSADTDPQASLQQLMPLLTSAEQPLAQLRLRQWQVLLLVRLGDAQAAQQALTAMQAAEQQLGQQQLSGLSLLRRAQVAKLQRQYAAAEQALQQALPLLVQQQQLDVQVQVLSELVSVSQELRHWTEAISWQKRLSELQQRLLQQQLDQHLAVLRSELDFSQQRRQIAQLEQQQQVAQLQWQVQRSQLWNALLALILLVVSITALSLWQRWRTARLQKQWQQQLHWHRQQVAQLDAGLRSWQATLSAMPQPILLFDEQWQLLAANDAFHRRFGSDEAIFTVDQLLSADHELWPRLAAAKHAEQHFIDEFLGSGLAPGRVQVCSLDDEKGWLLMQWLEADNSREPADESQDFATLIVQVMQHSLALWELVTQQTRVELAEQSQIWRVSIDDGRVRTRSFDRYLSLKTVPKQPRWREVLRTAHFVLGNCATNPEQGPEAAQQTQRQLLVMVQQLRALLQQQGAVLAEQP